MPAGSSNDRNPGGMPRRGWPSPTPPPRPSWTSSGEGPSAACSTELEHVQRSTGCCAPSRRGG
eukprot:6505626-Pyramimonas_sp.AAC.1